MKLRNLSQEDSIDQTKELCKSHNLTQPAAKTVLSATKAND